MQIYCLEFSAFGGGGGGRGGGGGGGGGYITSFVFLLQIFFKIMLVSENYC